MNENYSQALNHLLWGEWDNLFMIMIRSNDDLLSKKIQLFLQAYYSIEKQNVDERHDELIFYIEHALVANCSLAEKV